MFKQRVNCEQSLTKKNYDRVTDVAINVVVNVVTNTGTVYLG